MKSLVIIVILFSIIILSSCSLTKNKLVGVWTSSNKKLELKADNTFILDSISGTWTFSKKNVSFTFNDTTKNLGGGCKSLRYRSKDLVRPLFCNKPTHHFVVFEKRK